jgi:hypothetical protein
MGTGSLSKVCAAERPNRRDQNPMIDSI